MASKEKAYQSTFFRESDVVIGNLRLVIIIFISIEMKQVDKNVIIKLCALYVSCVCVTHTFDAVVKS